MTGAPEAPTPLLGGRLTAQLLAGEPTLGPVEATRHLLAIQGQDARAARLALRVRSTAWSASEIDDALTRERSLVVTWVNRGTLHLIAAEDEPLLHLLTTPQLRTSNDRRLSQTGVSPGQTRRGIDLIVATLTRDGPTTRRQLRDMLERHDIPVAGQALVHLLFAATLDGHILRGPVLGSEQAFTLAEDWLGPRPALDRDAALGELALRYLVAHSPADERDLAKWAGITLGDARRALGAIAARLEVRPDGLVELPGRTTLPIPPPRLLGPFDPILHGWVSRSFVLDDDLRDLVITTNGIFRATVLLRGTVGGTWTVPAGRPRLRVVVMERPDERAALAAEADEVVRYLTPPTLSD